MRANRREGRECEAQLEASAEESREGMEEAENARRPTIEAQSGEESREGVEESENARWPTIEAQSGEESREGVEESENARWATVCDLRHRRKRPLRLAPTIVDLRHPPDAAVAVASPVAVTSASKPSPFTYRILSFVRKTIKACRFSRSSRLGSAGEGLVREYRECEAQSEASAEESREGVEEAENARRPTIQAQSGEESREGVEESENARWPTIEAQPGEESREGVEESENARWATVCVLRHRRKRPPRSAPAIVDLRHPPDAAITVASPVAVASASKPPPFTYHILSFVKKTIKACRFSRSSRIGLAGEDLVREGRECEAQSEASVEESREGVEEAENARRPTIEGVEGAETAHWSAVEAQSGEKIMEGGFKGELHEETQGLCGRDVLEEGKSAGEAHEPCICDGSLLVEPPNVSESEKSYVQFLTQATKSEGDTRLEEGEVVDSLRAEGEIVDSLGAEVEEVDTELEEVEIVYSPWAKGSSPPSEQIADCMKQSRELLEKRTNSDATKALEFISKALSISMLSENLMEMKAEALLMMLCYKDVIQLCEHTRDSSEKNSDTTDMKDEKSCGNQQVSLEKLWRLHLMAKAYFYMGRFEEAIELLQKHEEVEPVAYMSGNMLIESSKSLSMKIIKPLGFRAVGNEAFESKGFSEAIEHYTAALAFSVESRPFSAICFYGRAIANQELGMVVDAIADCSLAIVLDQRYVEAISRRATLHELIRDYEQAANDLKMLISILESQTKVQGRMLISSKGLGKRRGDLEQARLRLCTLEEQARKGTCKDIYKILGVERSSSMIDVKNAYRRAAFKHHPDKSGLLLIKSENVNDGLWREVVDQIRLDADKLFKLIGEAYDVLSNASKCQEYDEEEDEEMWSSNRSGPRAGYEQRRNPYDFSLGYDFSQGYEQRRNSFDFSHGYDFSQGYEQRRNHYDFSQDYDFNRRGPRTGNERFEQRSNANDFNQGYNHTSNTSYFNRSDSRSSKEKYGRNGYGFNKDYKQRRNGPDFTRGYDNRSSTGYQERSHTSNFYRRYPHFNYQDLDAQYD